MKTFNSPAITKCTTIIFAALILFMVLIISTINVYTRTTFYDFPPGFQGYNEGKIVMTEDGNTSQTPRDVSTSKYRELHIDGNNDGTDQSASQNASCNQKLIDINDRDITLLDACKFLQISYDTELDQMVDGLQEISLPFLDNYHNPCWFESIPNKSDLMYRVSKQMFTDQVQRSYDVITPIIESRAAAGHNWRLRCLPLVYVLGVAKCGTTDLYGVLTHHEHVIKAATKEPMFWSYNRWVMGARMHDFIDTFDLAAERIRRSVTWQTIGVNDTRVYHPSITVDFSVETLFIFQGTKTLFHDNDKRYGPRHIAADMIKNLTPGAKIIVMIRNPTQRLYSEYKFFNKEDHNVEEFHSLATEAVTRINACLQHWSARYCVYEHQYTFHHKWVRLVAGIYAPFIEDWLEVFPHMKIYRTEDYHLHRDEILAETLEYIGLEPKLDIDPENIDNEGPKAADMLAETKEMLDAFYQPFNERLARVLHDKRFLFKDG